MDFSKYKLSWAEAVRHNTTKNTMITLLIAMNFITVFGWANSGTTTVLLPLQIEGPVEISTNKASRGYKTAWALTVAELLGNVTPGNADFIAESVGGILAPDAYRAMKSELAQQIKDIKDDSITVSFEPRQTIYEAQTDKVFVYGQFESVGPTGKPRTFMRTYEMQVELQGGRPWVTAFTPYTGQPKTLQALRTQGVARVSE